MKKLDHYENELCEAEDKIIQLQAEKKQLKEALEKYGHHLELCELVMMPFLGDTESHWQCNCGFSQADDCKLCNGEGYVIGLKLELGGYHTGHCPNCGSI